MSKRITVKGINIKFPPTCVVCQSIADQKYAISKTFQTSTKSSISINLNVPFCSKHYTLAMAKNQKEKAILRGGLICAIMLGGLTWLWAFLLWTGASRGGAIDLVGAIIFGLVALMPGGFVFIILWAIGNRIASIFAEPDAKAARGAVKIINFLPAKDLTTLEFANDWGADVICQLNDGQVVSK